MPIERNDSLTSAPSVAVIPSSHLDLFWLGDYRNCLRRGDDIIRSYLDRAVESGDETFVIDTAIFAEHFLAEHPEYEERMRRLLAEGRLEIGAAYIDRWENLVLGESLIRNIQIGRAWARDRLGLDTQLAAHPDLPGLNAQTAQIYAQAGIRYYVTSRKLFHEGRVWRHRAPDGTPMLMLTWPWHYVFLPLDESGLDIGGAENGAFVASENVLSYDDIESRYPHGVIAVSGSAGDLTSAADFVKRYGKDQREYVGQYRAAGLDIGYAIPATVLAPYLEADADLLEITGSLPSVWGVAPDEEMRFFHRVRALEALLLDAETASAIGVAAGRKPLPDSARSWRGLFAEDAFFAAADTPPEGKEWEWLWRMHVFTQDHNGGGQDGPLSIFQKKVRHDRAREYALDVLEHALGVDSSTQPALLRTRLGRSESELVLDVKTSAGLASWLETIPAGSWQVLYDDGAQTVALTIEPSTGIGAGPMTVDLNREAPTAEVDGEALRIGTRHVRVSVDRVTGTATIRDARAGAVWAVPLGGAYAVPELGNDVTLATDESARVNAVVQEVVLLETGPIVARVRIRWKLLDVVWTTTLRVWGGSPRVDVETVVDWPGFERWQIRMPLAAVGRESVTHGTPFHASGWLDLPAEERPLMPDEISPEDLAAYREVQHWVHVGTPDGESGLAVLTAHPAFHHDGSELEAVLLRTAPSCGDPRMAWTNPGRTVWSFTLLPVDADWREADVPELADMAWRVPSVVVAGAPQHVDLLCNEGDTVRLSALYLDGDEVVVRLVNQSGRDQTARLVGAAVGAEGLLTDLDGRPQRAVAAVDGVLAVTLPPWRIQTIRLGATRSE